MTGTILNIAAILIGGAVGVFFGNRLAERVRQTLVAGLGLFTAVIGLSMAFKSQQSLIVLGSVLIGGMLGEWWHLEERLRSLGDWLERRFVSSASIQQDKRLPDVVDIETQAAPVASLRSNSDQGSRFVRGFLTASLIYAIGPMAILGAIQDGLTGDYNLLAVKAVLDGFASLAFASSMGVGVLFSSLVVLAVQGSLSLLAVQAQTVMTPMMMDEMTAVGGVLLLGMAISSLLEIKPIRVGNFLPALIIAPLVVALLTAMGIQLK